MKQALKNNQTLRELIKYGIVGVIGILVDAGSLFLLVDVFKVSYPYSTQLCAIFGVSATLAVANILISNVISQILGAINNFILNSYFTFKVSDKKRQRFVPYVIMVVFGIILGSILMTLMVNRMQINYMVAKIVSIVIVAAMQFVVNKFIIFKKSK